MQFLITASYCVGARDEVETLLRRSKDFLRTARFQIDAGIYDLAVFNLEQALQLYLKAKLLELGAQYPRAYGLRQLLKLLQEVAPEEKRRLAAQLLDRYLLELGALEDAYINSRYVPRDYTREEAERLFKAVLEIINSGL